MAGKTDVAEAKQTGVSAEVYDYGEDNRAGFEDVTIADLSIPFITLMQSNSPQVEDDNNDIKAGDLVNSVTGEVLKQPVIVQPVFREGCVVEWVPRGKGGGLAGRHDLDSEVFLDAIKANNNSRIPPKDADGKRIPFKSPDGNDLVETYYVYCLLMDAEGKTHDGFGVLSFSSSKIKVYKKWLTSMMTQRGNPPIHAYRCKVTTAKEAQPGTGKMFYNYHIAPLGDTWRECLIPPNTEEGRALLAEGKNFADMINNGLARADFESIADESADTHEGGVDDDQTPF